MPWLLKMTLLVAVLMMISHAYTGWRIYRTMKQKQVAKGLKLLPAVLLLSFYLLPIFGLLCYWVWGNADMLTFSQPVVYWFWIGLVFSVQLLSWLLILDILTLGVRLMTHWKRTSINWWYRRIFIALAIILFVFTAVKMIDDTRSIEINKSTYSSADIPPGFDGFRIVHITDLQGDEFTGRKEIKQYINKVNEQQPDLVVFTGDLISYGTDFIAMAAEELSNAPAAHGIYAVIGDHDYWAGVLNIKMALDANGIDLLQDENTIIRNQNDSLLLTGITEVYSKHIPADSLQMLTTAYSEMPLKVMATHQATDKVIKQSREANYQLLLGGHTHGGQLRIPFMFMTFSAAEGDTPYLSGNYSFGDMLMNIDNGLGFTLAPIRYNAPPSISVIDLSTE